MNILHNHEILLITVSITIISMLYDMVSVDQNPNLFGYGSNAVKNIESFVQDNNINNADVNEMDKIIDELDADDGDDDDNYIDAVNNDDNMSNRSIRSASSNKSNRSASSNKSNRSATGNRAANPNKQSYDLSEDCYRRSGHNADVQQYYRNDV